jgi:hypothetical protein
MPFFNIQMRTVKPQRESTTMSECVGIMSSGVKEVSTADGSLAACARTPELAACSTRDVDVEKMTLGGTLHTTERSLCAAG